MSFRIKGLDAAPFLPLFTLDDAALVEKSMRRVVIDAPHSAPCRTTLEDASPGERVILLPFAHHGAHSPYRASGPVYVREQARTAFDRIDELPPVFEGRLLAVRAYDADGMMTDADVAESDPRVLFDKFLADPADRSAGDDRRACRRRERDDPRTPKTQTEAPRDGPRPRSAHWFPVRVLRCAASAVQVLCDQFRRFPPVFRWAFRITLARSCTASRAQLNRYLRRSLDSRSASAF